MNLLWFSSQTYEDHKVIRFVVILVLASTLCAARSNYCDLCDNHVACGNNGVSGMLILEETLSLETMTMFLFGFIEFQLTVFERSCHSESYIG